MWSRGRLLNPGNAYTTLSTIGGVGFDDFYTIDLRTGGATLVGTIGDGTISVVGASVACAP